MRLYDAAGRLKIAALWAALSGTPDRVKEIEVLVDPNALRYVGWNDVTNQLELLQFAAEDIPYDNTASGLTAVDVQAAIDEAVAAATPNVFAGFVSSLGTTGTSNLPAGWTVTRPAAGRYVVVHNLALSGINGLSPVGTPQRTTFSIACQLGATTANQFEMRLMQENETLTSTQWFFVAVINE